jgi:acyl-coenzyme A synthetase/AMP-(fatty) acid ligase
MSSSIAASSRCSGRHRLEVVGSVEATSVILSQQHLYRCCYDCLDDAPELLENATAAARQARVEKIFVYGDAVGATPFASLLQADGEPPNVSIDPANDVVALPYSSGTTGRRRA